MEVACLLYSSTSRVITTYPTKRANVLLRTRLEIAEEDQVHVAKGVCRRTSSGARRWFLVLVDRAEHPLEALPSIVVEHGRRHVAGANARAHPAFEDPRRLWQGRPPSIFVIW